MADPVRRVLALVPVLAALIMLGAVPLPVYVVAPGPARDVLPLISVSDREVFRPQGRLLLTTVTLQRATAVEVLRGWIDRYEDVVPERVVVPPGITPEEEDAIQRSRMDESKLTAAHVALARVTDYPTAHGSGALVHRVHPDGPADGVLFSGDLIVSVSGRAVGSAAELQDAVSGAGADRDLSLEVRVEDAERTVRIRPRAGSAGGGLGADLIDNFPFPVLIESGDIGGPSAGLMWALGLVDLLTVGDLTGGRPIAGTGTIELDGTVGPIGGIEQKIVAAERAGALVFLVPRGDLEAARAVPSELELVPVDDLGDALAHLEATCRCPGL